MMDDLPAGRRGQVLAVAIGVLGAAILWFGIVDPALSWFGDRQVRLQQRRELLVHMRDLAASVPALLAASAARSGQRADAATTLPGDSDAVAAAKLQERVQQVAADVGASLTAVETLPSAPEAGRWHKVALRISLTASWPVLVELISVIAQSPTRILIDDVHFRSSAFVVHPTELPIQASIVVYGFRGTETGTGS